MFLPRYLTIECIYLSKDNYVKLQHFIYSKGVKPMLVEKGPYVFQEFHHKFDEVWNENGTVTYKQKKKWIHISGNLKENVTIINSLYVTIMQQYASV